MGSISVVIPPPQLHKILNKAEDEVEAMDSQNETLQAPYTIINPEIYVNSFHFNVANKQLTRDIPEFIENIAEELGLAFEKYWGSESEKGEWKTVGAWDTCQKIVARTANRVFLGTDIYRNEVFLDNSRQYALCVFGGGIIINTMPGILKQIFGYFMGWQGKRHLRACQKILIPMVEERLRNTSRLTREQNFKWTPPFDALQWIIEECEKTEDPKQFEPALIAHRLMMLNLVSVHTTSNTIINVILDLYSSPRSSGFLEGIHEEYTRALAEAGGVWTRYAVSQLYRVDSCIRESMRYSAFGIVALPRRVNSEKGLQLDDKSILPKGVRMTFPMQAIHHDESF
ncbi:hypothetical protein MMC25_003816 [Agyrium rufum]|nr:hypothetical protein [Agyrium rufum]